MFSGPGRVVTRESQVEESAIVRPIFETVFKQACRLDHAVALAVSGEMTSENLLGLLEEVTAPDDAMRYVVPEQRYDHSGPALILNWLGCVIETLDHLERVLGSTEWDCFTTQPRLLTLPVEHAVSALTWEFPDDLITRYGGVYVDLCRDYDIVTIRSTGDRCDEIARSLIKVWDPAPAKGIAWIMNDDRSGSE